MASILVPWSAEHWCFCLGASDQRTLCVQCPCACAALCCLDIVFVDLFTLYVFVKESRWFLYTHLTLLVFSKLCTTSVGMETGIFFLILEPQNLALFLRYSCWILEPELPFYSALLWPVCNWYSCFRFALCKWALMGGKFKCCQDCLFTPKTVFCGTIELLIV